MPIQGNFRDQQYKQVPLNLSRPSFLPPCSMSEEPALCSITEDVALKENISLFWQLQSSQNVTRSYIGRLHPYICTYILLL